MPLTREAIFDLWAPSPGKWSVWAKPVLFAHMPSSALVDRIPPEPMDLTWLPPATGDAGIVADLPTEQGIPFGLAAAQMGYRPVPLYNAAPGPSAVVPVLPILLALQDGAEKLIELRPPINGPPVFLLDSQRRLGQSNILPGMFDNRSVSFPSDFPSANFLLSQGIQTILLVRREGTTPQTDLSHTLLRWQEAGIVLLAKAITEPDQPVPITVKKPSGFRSLWHAVMVAAGLRRNPLGGFGGRVPNPSSGHGG